MRAARSGSGSFVMEQQIIVAVILIACVAGLFVHFCKSIKSKSCSCCGSGSASKSKKCGCGCGCGR